MYSHRWKQFRSSVNSIQSNLKLYLNVILCPEFHVTLTVATELLRKVSSTITTNKLSIDPTKTSPTNQVYKFHLLFHRYKCGLQN